MKKTARDNFRKSALENSKVPVTLFEKNVSRALWGVTEKKHCDIRAVVFCFPVAEKKRFFIHLIKFPQKFVKNEPLRGNKKTVTFDMIKFS